MYIIDSGASLHSTGLASQTNRGKKTIRSSSNVLHIQTATGTVVTITQPNVNVRNLGVFMGFVGGELSVSAIVRETMWRTWLFLLIECSTEKFVSMVAVAKHRLVSSAGLPAEGDLERRPRPIQTLPHLSQKE